MFVTQFIFTLKPKKMKFTKITLALAVACTVAFTSCKPKDADIKANIEKAMKADPTMATTIVDVKDGVVTISGVCKDEACKANCEKTAASVKGVKPPVINNCTIAEPEIVVAPPASTTTMLDAATQQKVKDGLKDMPGVTVTFEADKAILAGEVTKAQRMAIMQMTMAANVKTDVSKLMDKK